MRMTLAERQERTRAFMWAWEKLEGWGPTAAGGGKERNWTFYERIQRSRELGAYAVAVPLYGDFPSEVQPARKRWRAIEEPGA